MTDVTEHTVTVDIEVLQTHEYTIADDEIPAGQTISDVALNRAVEHARGELIDWPLAFVEVSDIQAVKSE
jgi:hypothetical protein